MGLALRPCPATSRRATPPVRGTVQISPAKSKAISSRESEGCWSRSGGAAADADPTKGTQSSTQTNRFISVPPLRGGRRDGGRETARDCSEDERVRPRDGS